MSSSHTRSLASPLLSASGSVDELDSERNTPSLPSTRQRVSDFFFVFPAHRHSERHAHIPSHSSSRSGDEEVELMENERRESESNPMTTMLALHGVSPNELHSLPSFALPRLPEEHSRRAFMDVDSRDPSTRERVRRGEGVTGNQNENATSSEDGSTQSKHNRGGGDGGAFDRLGEWVSRRKLVVFGTGIFYLAAVLLISIDYGWSFQQRACVALLVLMIGHFAFLPIPLDASALLFFILFPLFGVVSSDDIYLYFSSNSFWVMFGGVALGAIIRHNHLDSKLCSLVIPRLRSPTQALFLLIFASSLFGLLVPSMMVRVTMVFPVIEELSRQYGFQPKSRPYDMLMISATVVACNSGIVVSTGSIISLIAERAADLFQIRISYLRWFVLMFPVYGIIQPLVSFVILCIGFRTWSMPWPGKKEQEGIGCTLPREEPGQSSPVSSSSEEESVRIERNRNVRTILLFILAIVLLFVSTWINMRTSTAILIVILLSVLPFVGVVPTSVLSSLNLVPLLYFGAILLASFSVHTTGVGERLTNLVDSSLQLGSRSMFSRIYVVILASTVFTFFPTTAVGCGIVTPIMLHLALLPHISIPTDLTLVSVVIGSSFALFPFQIGPLQFIRQKNLVSTKRMVFVMGSLQIASIFISAPLSILYWSLIGAF